VLSIKLKFIKIKVFIGVLIATVTPQFLFAQNTFPVSGNVGVGTSTPSERLDVNGDMVVNASLRVKDSLGLTRA
jgi:hypothetical protein